MSRPACSGETPFPGRATKIFSRDLYSLAAASMANLRGLHVLFGEQRREEQGLAGIVEAFAAGAIGGKGTAEIDLYVQQVANGGGIFIAIQAADGERAREPPPHRRQQPGRKTPPIP